MISGISNLKSEIFPVSSFIFFTRAEGPLSYIIRRVTKSDLGPEGTAEDGWSHTGIGYVMSDKSMKYFEASVHDKGFAGPRDYQDVKDWVAKDSRRAACAVDLKLNPEQVKAKYAFTQLLVGVASYSVKQLALLWFRQRVGRHFGYRVPAMAGLICSEAVAHILHPDLVLTDAQHIADEITPNRIYAILLTRITASRSTAFLQSQISNLKFLNPEVAHA